MLEDFLPKQRLEYSRLQVKIAEPRAWKEDVPVFFRNRPEVFRTHLQRRIQEASRTIVRGMVKVYS